MNHFRPMALMLVLFSAACGSGGAGGSSVAPGTGGALSGGASGGHESGGSTGAGGGSGGTSGSGGASTLVGTGGSPGSGGSSGSGGAKSTGGATGTGGNKGTGGAIGTGGLAGAKGTGGAGGSKGSGGAPGTGGATTTIDGGSAGVPFKGVANSPCAVRAALGVSWYYNWTWSPENCTGGGGGEFVPMYSNKPNKNPTPEAVAAQIDKLANAGYKYVLGFNEPNKTDQANMTVASAIALWPAMTRNPNILVGSPATSADGQAWFKDFLTQAQAQSLRIDFIALHWYGWNVGSCDAKAANLESYIKWAEGLPGNLPLWLTEWGCMNASNPDEATVLAFYQGAAAMLAKHPRVERYAWYPWNTNNHVANDDGSLTAIGTVFAAQPSTR